MWVVAVLATLALVRSSSIPVQEPDSNLSLNASSLIGVDASTCAQSAEESLIPPSWFYFQGQQIPEIPANASLEALLQTGAGERSGTPKNFTVTSSSLVSGRWKNDHGCCSGHWWDVHRRYNPEVMWDGTPEGTFSMVVMADDIDENARIHWLVVNIDPREHYFRMGTSGRCNWWQMIYRRCPRGRIPAAALEVPNRWGQWRFSAFCPPRDQDHRYRIRVFAQKEWDQRYLDIRYTGVFWPPLARSSEDIVRQLMPTNLAVATLIGKFQRPRECGGPMYTDGGPPDQIEGLVADYDFSTKTLFSMVEGAPPIQDIGASCSRSGHFAYDNAHRKYSATFDFIAGNGFKIPDVDLLLGSENGYQYTLVLDVMLRRTTCWTRILNIKPNTADNNDGLYLCDGLFVYPAGARSGYVHANKWTMLAIATNADRQVRLFVDGKKHFDGKLNEENWKNLRVTPGPTDDRRKQPGQAPFMALFNYCGDSCNCLGGETYHTSGRARRIQLYNKMLDTKEMELLFARAIVKDIDVETRA